MLGWVGDMIGRATGRAPANGTLPLYQAIVTRARQPHWYLDGQVPDSVDGRFDMIAAVLSAVLLRLEGDPAGPEPSARLAERFVDDMDGQLRQIGIGDIVVGKHIGRMMSMLGGRLGAYRDGLAAGDLSDAVTRNVFRGVPPSPGAVAHVAGELAALSRALAATGTPALIGGQLP